MEKSRVKDVKEGYVGRTSQGDTFEVVESLNYRFCVVKFLDEFGYTRKADKSAVIAGNVKNPFRRSFYGVGYIGDGQHTSVTSPRQYKIWQRMLERCYSSKHPAYHVYGGRGVFVCAEWHNFQNFAEWCPTQEGYKDKLFELDKDLLVKDNLVYSPSTCCFIPTCLNSFFLNAKTKIKKDEFLATGVTKTPSGAFRAMTNEYKLGTFPTEKQAELAYLNYKKYSLWLLACEYKGKIDSHVYERLLELSAPSWKDFVTDEMTYKELIQTGMAHVWYRDLPLSWSDCLKELEEEKKEIE